MTRCYSISLGCPKNRVDTEHILGMPALGIRMVDSPAKADFVFVNTCGFIRPAIEESVRTIAEMIEDTRRLKKRPKLVVAGCLVGRYSEGTLGPELPEVDLWLDNAQLESWPRLLAEGLGLEAAPEAITIGRLVSTGPSYAWLKLSDGCEHKCSFCTIPAIRGPLRSQAADTLVEEAKGVLGGGVKELVLVAQDLTVWGKDLGLKHGLQSLLDRLLPLEGLKRLRLMYLYPAGLTEELLGYLQGAGAPFVPYFDVPLQHAHPDVLTRMGRPFARDPRKIIDRIRSYFPDAALRTSLITGFPGETDAQFADLLRFVEATRFTNLGVFAYQAEEGTPAALMPDQIDESLKQERREAIMQAQRDISEEWLAQFERQHLEILVDAPHPEWPGLHTGRAWFQAPEIDGLVYISGPGVEPGALVDAEIVECREYDLVALA